MLKSWSSADSFAGDVGPTRGSSFSGGVPSKRTVGPRLFFLLPGPRRRAALLHHALSTMTFGLAKGLKQRGQEPSEPVS